jgi:hypothetical protein
MFKHFKKKVVAWLGPSLAYWTITVLGWTMKFEEVRTEIPRSFLEKGIFGIGAFWHWYERAVLARNRDAILALLDADPLGWRDAVLAAQVPRTGAIAFLLARPGVRFPPGSCCSCGDPRPADQYRCTPCTAATVHALAAAQAAGAWV